MEAEPRYRAHTRRRLALRLEALERRPIPV